MQIEIVLEWFFLGVFLAMDHDQREGLSHNRIHVADVFQDNEKFIYSFMPPYDSDRLSDTYIVADEEGYDDLTIKCNEVQTA